MFLDIFEQISNASLFDSCVKTHSLEGAFEICRKDQKQKNSNSGVVLIILRPFRLRKGGASLANVFLSF
jgi:hypothetical protein